jgi:threonine efflux protein
VNLTNPKSLVYYTSVFAAMIPPAASLSTRIAVVAVVVAESAVWHASLAALFATPRLQRAYRRCARWIDRVAGGAFVAVGARLLSPRAARAPR